MSRYKLFDITLRSYNDWASVPRDPREVVKKIVETILGVTFGPVGTFIFNVLYYGASTAITYKALSSLAEAKFKDALEKSSGRLVNVRDPASPHQYIYGKVRKGGTIVYLKTTGENNKYLHMVIALAGHEVNSIGDIYLNDEIVTITGDYVSSAPWNDKIYIKKYSGNQTTSPAILDDGVFTETEIGRGIAYLYVRLEYDQDIFANGMPNVTAVVEGKKVYDPRDSGQNASDSSTWTYSANAALCVADYLRADYGLGDTDYGRIDDTMLQAAANVCDENVTLSAGGTENRYECHGVLSAENTPADNLGRMLTSCNGTIFWGSGKWKIKAGSYTSPVKDFTLDDLRSEISLKTRTSARDNFNAVQGTFADATADWITVDYPQIKSTGTFLFEDGGVENILDLSLPFTTSSTMAQRLAKQTLFRSREQMALTAEFGMSAFELEIGDIVRLTIDRYGFTNKEFEVVSWALVPNADAGDMRIAMTLQETSEAAFAWDAEETAITTNNTTLPKYDDQPSFGFTPTIEFSSYSKKSQRDLVIQLTSSVIDRLESFEVQIKRSLDSNGLLSSEGIIDPQAVTRGLADEDDLFSTELIGSRKIGDLDNDGDVDADDVGIYVDYYYNTLTNSDQLDRIDALHRHMIADQDKFSNYLVSQFVLTETYQTIYTGAPDLARIKDFAVGIFDIRVRAFTKLGLRTNWLEYERFEVPFSDPNIASPSNATISVNDISSLELSWSESASESLSHYEIRHSDLIEGQDVAAGSLVHGNHYVVTNVGTACDWTDACGVQTPSVGLEFWATGAATDAGGDATAANVVYIDKTVPWVNKVGRPANNITCGVKEGTYVVRAFSKMGTPSINYAKAAIRSTDFDNPFASSTTFNTWTIPSNYTTSPTIVEFDPPVARYPHFGFLYPDSDDGFISKAVFNGSTAYDHSSVDEIRITFDYDFVRMNFDNKLYGFTDNVFGQWDNLGMLVDDVSNEYQSDFKITPYVRMRNSTSDNFSSWQRVTSNIVSGRYFEFKVEVISDAYDAGPTFHSMTTSGGVMTGGITVTLEYN